MTYTCNVILLSFLITPTPCIVLHFFFVIWLLKFSFYSRKIPKCFLKLTQKNSHIVETDWRVRWFCYFPGNYNFPSLLVLLWIKWHFRKICQFRYLCKSWFNLFAELLGSWTIENNDVSSTNFFTVDIT